MSAPVILVSGTWGRKSADSGSYFWWKPPSVFIANLNNAGLQLVHDVDYFDWSTNLDGVDSHNDDWETAGKALYWYWAAHGKESVSIIGHSHAAQVIAYALQYSLFIRDEMDVYRLVTVASPVRFDLQVVWDNARKVLPTGAWTHLYTNETGPPSDQMQIAGSAPLDKHFGFRRDMPQADRNIEISPGITHHWMINSKTWNDHNLWQYAGAQMIEPRNIPKIQIPMILGGVVYQPAPPNPRPIQRPPSKPIPKSKPSPYKGK